MFNLGSKPLPVPESFCWSWGHNVMQMLAFRRWAINIIMNYCGSFGTGWFASPGLCLQHACTRQPASAPLWPWNLQAVTRTCLTQTGSSLTCNLFFTICAAMCSKFLHQDDTSSCDLCNIIFCWRHHAKRRVAVFAFPFLPFCCVGVPPDADCA